MSGCDIPESSGDINGDTVEVGAQTGDSGEPGDATGSDDGSADDGPGSVELVPVPGEEGTPVSFRRITGGPGDGGAITCGAVVLCDPQFPEVTLADMAAFRPTAPSQGMEPDGWAVVGLPANFFARASAEVKAGPLLGFDARVRFTPVRYVWSFGDGSSVSSTTGGAGWASLGLPEFSETATSHVFSSSGTFTVRLTVRYAAEYSFAGRPWRTIVGTVGAAANEIVVTTGSADTVLVSRNCLQNPSGPGC